MPIYTKTPNGWEAIAQDAKAVSSFGSIVPDGNQTDEGTYTDADGREWVWYEWATAGDYSASLSGGLYWVLCVGGGDGGVSSQTAYNEGQPGLVNEGLWEFSPSPTTAITVGSAGAQNTNDLGDPSSIGSYGNQGRVSFGSMQTGRGALGHDNQTGYKSFITGAEREFAPGQAGPNVPGRAGHHNQSGTQNPGCVIIATVVNGAKPKPVQPALTPATIVSAPVKVSGSSDPVEWIVKQTDGKRKKITLLPGNTGVNAGIPIEPRNRFEVTLSPGALNAVLVAAGGGGGGSANGSAYFGGGGGAGGVTGTGTSTPIILPVQQDQTYVIEVGGTTPGSIVGDEPKSQGQHTSIAIKGEQPFHTAVGGGYGWCHRNGTSVRSGEGGSGGGAMGAAWTGGNNKTEGLPGQGNGGGPPSGSTAGGGGGYGSAGKANWVGGDGFNLKDSLSLDGTDAATVAFLDAVTDGGFIAGGGSSNNAEPGPGGGRGQNSASGGHAQDYTGSGGGNTGPGGTAGNGACGMVLLIEDA